MLVVDNNKTKLLKMKEKLLEVGNNLESNLHDYKEIAIDIDKQVFNALINKIENTDLHNLSLEEQLVCLNDINSEYNDVFEMQCGFKNVYFEYAKEELELSNLDVILIDDIRTRINNIQGYLVSINSVNDNKKELERLNLELISESKKNDNLAKKFKDLELELKNSFLNAEGRNYDYEGKLVYNSVVSEYEGNSLDIKQLLENQQFMDSELDRITELKKAADEKLSAAKICYNRMPTNENRDVFDSIRYDSILINYKMTLLYIANLISKECSEFSSVLLKRKQIISLNEERKKCLKELGINISIDPFDRIRLHEQIDIISLLGSNSEQIEIIKRKIGYFDSLIEDKIKEKNEYMYELRNDIQLLKKSNIVEIFNVATNNVVVDMPSKVIDIRDISNNMNKKRIAEKTNGVIKRVYSMFCEDEHNDKEQQEFNDVAPTLVVEPAIQDETFNDNMPDLDINNQSTDVNDESVIVDDIINNILDKQSDTKKVEFNDETSHVFNDVVPFESAPLFEERTNSDIFDSNDKNDLVINLNKNSEESDSNIAKPEKISNEFDQMPDVFWTVDDDSNKNVVTDNDSFDN